MRHTVLWEQAPELCRCRGRSLTRAHPQASTARPGPLWQTRTERGFLRKYSRGLEWLTGVIWG